MVGQAPTVFIPESASTNKAHGFNGQDFYYQRGKTKRFLESRDMDLWDIIQIGPFIPKKRNQAGGEIDKLKEEWTLDERARVLLNSKAMLFLTCASTRLEYDKRRV